MNNYERTSYADAGNSAQVRQMHSAAYMSWWSNNLKKISAHTSLVSDAEELKERIAYHFGLALLGKSGEIISADNGDTLLLRSGYTDSAGADIYCVLTRGSAGLPGEEKKPGLVLTDFVTGSDSSRLGDWLKNNELINGGDRQALCRALEKKCREVISLSGEAVAPVKEFLAEIEQGRVPAAGLSCKVAQLEKSTAELRDLYLNIFGRELSGDVTVQMCLDMLREPEEPARAPGGCEPGVNAEELLNTLVSGNDVAKYLAPTAEMMKNETVRAVVLADREEMKRLLADRGSEVLDYISSAQMNGTMTFGEASERLRRTIGEEGGYAEAYAILGAGLGDRKCMNALMSQYMREGLQSRFMKMFEHSAAYSDPEPGFTAYFIRLSALNAPRAAKRFLTEKPYLLKKEAVMIAAEANRAALFDEQEYNELMTRAEMSTEAAAADDAVLAEEEMGDCDRMLRRLHRAAAQRRGDTRALTKRVCRLYEGAVKNNAFPDELLSEAYRICERGAKEYRLPEALSALCCLESRAGNKLRAEFLRIVISDCESCRKGEESFSAHGYYRQFKAMLTELGIPEISEHITYANRVLRAFLKSLTNSEPADDDIEARCDKAVRSFYITPYPGTACEELARLPLSDNTAAYVKLLQMLGRYDFSFRGKCVEWCISAGLDDETVQSLRLWAESKDKAACLRYLEDKLNADPDFFAKRAGNGIRELSAVLCTDIGPEIWNNHNSATAAVHIAVKLGYPEAVDALLDNYRDVLFGSKRSVGLVLGCRLLKKHRWNEAQRVFDGFAGEQRDIPFGAVAEELQGMTANVLEQWTSDPVNRALIDMILPEGSHPVRAKIQRFVYNGIVSGNAARTAAVVCRLMEMFPDDYILCNSLYDLACTHYDGYITDLHRSLRRLAMLKPWGDSSFFYKRTPAQYANMLAALDAVLISTNRTYLAEDYDFDTGTGDFIRPSFYQSPDSDLPDKVNELRSRITEELDLCPPDRRQRLTKAYLSSITGNWTEVIRGFVGEAGDEFANLNEYLVVSVDGVAPEEGFVRSFIRVAAELSPDSRAPFIERFVGSIDEHLSPATLKRYISARFVRYVQGKKLLEAAERLGEPYTLRALLNEPFEDYSYFDIWEEKYVKPFIDEHPEEIYCYIFIMAALICSHHFQKYLAAEAYRFFRQHDDRRAVNLFFVLRKMTENFHLTTEPEDTSEDTWKWQYDIATYYAATQVSSVMSKKNSAEFKNKNYEIWTLINMIMVLLKNNRGNEIEVIAARLGGLNSRLLHMILRGIDRDVPDEDKYAALEAFENDKTVDDLTKLKVAVYYSFLVKFRVNSNSMRGFYLLKDREWIDKFDKKYIDTCNRITSLKEQFGTADPRASSYQFVKGPRITNSLILYGIKTESFDKLSPQLTTADYDYLYSV